MKTSKTTLESLRRSFVKSAFALALFLVFSASVNAQAGTEMITGTARVALKENAVKNLINNIGSPNEGVRKSSIYYAGYYRVNEAMKPLVERYRKETDPSSRILIVLSLYKIDERKGLDMIESFAKADPDAKVRRMFNAALMERLASENRFAAE